MTDEMKYKLERAIEILPNDLVFTPKNWNSGLFVQFSPSDRMTWHKHNRYAPKNMIARLQQEIQIWVAEHVKGYIYIESNPVNNLLCVSYGMHDGQKKMSDGATDRDSLFEQFIDAFLYIARENKLSVDGKTDSETLISSMVSEHGVEKVIEMLVKEVK